MDKEKKLGKVLLYRGKYSEEFYFEEDSGIISFCQDHYSFESRLLDTLKKNFGMDGIMTLEEAINKAKERGILREVSLDDLELREFRDKYVKGLSWLNQFNQCLEYYLKLRNSKIVLPADISLLLDEVDNFLLNLSDNNWNLIRMYSWKYREIISIINEYPKINKEKLEKVVEDLRFNTNDIKKNENLERKREKNKNDIQREMESFSNNLKGIIITDSRLEVLVKKQYDNMLYYYKNPDMLYNIDNVSCCNQKLSEILKLLAKGENYEYKLFNYETECLKLSENVNASRMFAEISNKIRISFGKGKTSESTALPKPDVKRIPPERSEIKPRTPKPGVVRPEVVKPEAPKPRVARPESSDFKRETDVDTEVSFKPRDIVKFLARFRIFREKVYTRVNESCRKVLRNILANECFYFEHQELTDEDVFKIVNIINELCGKISLALKKGDDISKYQELLEQADNNLSYITNNKKKGLRRGATASRKSL